MESSPSLPIQGDPHLLVTDRLQAELRDLFTVTRIGHRDRGRAITFTGQLRGNPDSTYIQLQQRFRPYGYTPLLRREKGDDVIVATPGVLTDGGTGNPFINVVLFIATVITTLAAGAMLAGTGVPFELLLAGHWAAWVSQLLTGIPFAASLLLILGVHELGHYFAARWHGVSATLPYFIPMPVIGLGTLGAFIAIRSPMRNRRVLFDIGLAGPLAGFFVALPLLVVGLSLSTPVPYFSSLSAGITLRMVGVPWLVQVIVDNLVTIPAGNTLALHPIAFAAWFGLLITGFNLLPIGQLDGGHVSYAALGKHAHTVARICWVLLIIAGAIYSYMWLFWAFFVLLGGIRHAPPLNDVTGLNAPRLLLATLAVALFFLLIVPEPFSL